MTRATALLLCSWLAMLDACTSSAGDGNERAEPATPALAPEPRPSERPPMTEMSAEALDQYARECQGVRLREQFSARSPAELESLATATTPSLRLLAIWERDRSFAATGPLVATSLDRLVPAFATALGQASPQWWIDQLASATQRDSIEPPYYDGAITEQGDRRGKWQVGPGGARVRSAGAMLLSETAGKLSYDLSMGRVILGPLPTEPGAMIEHARAQGATTTYYSTFSQGSGGFRFPLWAIESDGSQAWTAQVCGPDRQLLGGLGHLIVEIVVLDSGAGIAVFTAESHGVALDVFDPVTGARTLAWSSDFWFSRSV